HLEIQSLLKNLQQARVPLEITFAGRSQTCQSFIVELDPVNGTLAIDEMIPNIGDKSAGQGEAFQVDAWLEGAHLRWHSEQAARVLLTGSPAFGTPRPRRLRCNQRRGAYRTTVQRSIDPRVELIHSKHHRQFAGELLDSPATGG